MKKNTTKRNKAVQKKGTEPSAKAKRRKTSAPKQLDADIATKVLTNVNPESVLLMEKNGRALFSNRVFAKMMGKGLDEIVGESVYTILPPETASAWKERVKNVIETGAPERFEEVFGEKHTENYLYPLHDATGKHTQLAFFGIDITERKRMERALRESEEKFKELFDSAPIGYHEIDADGRIVNINHTELEMLGYTHDEMVGKFVWQFVFNPEASQKRVLAKLSGELPVTKTAERLYLRKDGTKFHALMDERLMKDENGKIIGIRTVLQDITERKYAEEELRESEERFRVTLYSIGDGVITTDMNGCVLQMNPVAEVMTGWSEKEARGKRITDVFHIVSEETGNMAENPVHRVLREGVVVGLANHTALIAKDGTRRPIADSGAPIRNQKGETIGVVLVFNDQSERRFLQHQLLQSQKMEAIGRLAGGIAHDFNNIIAIILGYAKLIEHDLSPLDPIAKKVQGIVSAAERSAELTNQLLAFARRQVVTPVVLNLNSELSTLQSMLTRLIGEDITLTLLSGKDLWNIKIDRSQIGQVIANLATNARDAINDVGTITVETSNIAIDETYCKDHLDFHPGEYVMLAFSDTGSGMDKATIARIFEPFFTTKAEGEGSGLGLATVFGIIKQNNGFINVYSEVGKGTTFKLYFPRFHGTEEAPVKKQQEIPLKGTETVLVVEDEEQLLDLAKSSLELYGYNVFTAKSPGDAIVLCERSSQKFDLLITDVVMPGMNGKELKERLETLKPEMKVIYMSGYTADVVAHRGILDASVNFLQKPFTPLALARKVREVLNG